MSELANLQRAIQQAILEPNSTDVNKYISDLSRLEIYQDMIQARFLEVLENELPTLVAYLGEDKFSALAGPWIQENPTSRKIMRDYAYDFVKQLSEQPISDLALFDWLMTEALDSADQTMLTVEDLQAIPQDSWAGFIFKPVPSVRVMTSCYAIAEYWQALDEDEQLDELTSTDEHMIMIWQYGSIMSHCKHLSRTEMLFYQAMLQQHDFAAYCYELTQHYSEDEVAELAINTVVGFSQLGILAGN